MLLVLIVSVFGFGSVYGQGFLSKTKAQVKTEIPNDVATSPINGYDKYWWGNAGKEFYTYFNSKGICFLEKIILSNPGIAQMEIDRRSKDSKYHCYYPQNNNSHEFVQGKISLEVIIKRNSFTGQNEYYLWYYKSEYKQDVLQFFEKYYK